jgi:hypothetical protein
MECNEGIGDLPPCSVDRSHENIINAGKMIGIDLTKPIDLSQMAVNSIQHGLHEDSYSLSFNEKTHPEFYRMCQLHTYVINEFNEREELTIEFKLISKRLPKF